MNPASHAMSRAFLPGRASGYIVGEMPGSPFPPRIPQSAKTFCILAGIAGALIVAFRFVPFSSH
jgi:hypothetical protein